MSEFRVGDKVILDPKRHFYSPRAQQAKESGEVGTVTDSMDSLIDVEFPKAGRVYGILKYTALPAPSPRDDRAETLAYIQGKLDRAVKDHEKAIEDEAEADKRKMAARARVDEFRAQIKALEVPEQVRGPLQKGDRVQVIRRNFNSYGQAGTVDRVTVSGYLVVQLDDGSEGTYLWSELEAI